MEVIMSDSFKLITVYMLKYLCFFKLVVALLVIYHMYNLTV